MVTFAAKAKIIGEQKSKFSISDAQSASLVDNKLSHEDYWLIPSSRKFSIIKDGDNFFVTSSDEQLQKSISDARAYKIKSARVKEVIASTNQVFDENIVFGSFEQKIDFAAGARDEQSKQIKKLIARKKHYEQLKIEANNLGDERSYKLYGYFTENLSWSVKRLRICGAVLRPKAESLKVISDKKRRSFAGLLRCNSIFCCYCGARKMRKRSLLISKKLQEVFEQNKRVVFFTVNLRHHHSFYNYPELRKVLFANFADLIQADFFRKANKGMVRVSEITYSIQRGYNVHSHILLCINPNEDLNILKKQIEDFWCSNITKYDRTSDFSKQDWFVEVKNTSKDIKKISNYFSSGIANSSYSIADELSSNRKEPLWNALPPEIYATVFYNSQKVKFFSSSKLLEIKESDLLEESPDAPSRKLKEKETTVLLDIPKEKYNDLDLGSRILIKAIVEDRSLLDSQVVQRVNSLLDKYFERFPQSLFGDHNQSYVNSC